MEAKLSIVLPVYNAESTIRGQIDRLLEQAGELTPQFEVVVVDDGSTDDTFDIANEVATRYPQVSVIRQPQRRGLGAVIRRVKRRLSGRWVMVHDGVSPLETSQLRRLWNQRELGSRVPTDQNMAAELRHAALTHAALADAHSRLAGFQWMSMNDGPEASLPADRPQPQSGATTGIGSIPKLPKQRIFCSFSEFALGE